MDMVSIYKHEFKIIHFATRQHDIFEDATTEGKTDVKQW